MKISSAQAAEAGTAATRARPGAGLSFSLAVAAATLLALVTGLHDLGSESLTRDEITSAFLSGRSLGDIFEYEPAQGLYTSLLKIWTGVGDSEFVVRLPSALCFAATVPLVAVLGRRLFDARTGVVAAVLLALNGFGVRYAQEARAYSLVLFLVTVSCVCYVHAVERRSPTAWTLWASTIAVAVLVHSLAVFVAVAQVSALLFLPPGTVPWRRVLAGGAIVAAASAVMAVISEDQQNVANSLSVAGVRRTVLGLAGGENRLGLAMVTAGAAAVAGGAAVAAGVRAWSRHGRSPEAWRTGFVVCWLVIPFALMVLFSALVRPLLVARYLLVSLPALVILVAAGLSRVRSRAVFAVALLGLVVLLGRGLLQWYGQTREEWREAAAFVAATADPDDAVVVYPYLNYCVGYYYDRSGVPPASRPQIYNACTPGRTSSASATSCSADDPGLRRRLTGRERVWLIIVDPQHQDLRAARAPVAAGRKLVSTRRLSALQVERYEATG